MPDDGLTGQLETRRNSLIDSSREILAVAARENRPTTEDEDTRYAAAMDEVEKLNTRIDDLGEQAKREERARAARAGQEAEVVDDHGSGAQAAGVQVTSEPTVYETRSPNSYWLDLARAELNRGADVPGARERLSRHVAELAVELPKRQERRARLAKERIEGLHTGSRHEERALERFYGNAAWSVFRAGNRWRSTAPTAPAVTSSRRCGRSTSTASTCACRPRAGRPGAPLHVPLPAGTDSINLPRITTGTATGVQTSDGGGVPGRDLADNFSNALVRTIAGQEDVAIQLLDQSPIAFDQVISRDLMADYAMQLDGQVLLGSGSSGQG